MKFKNIPLNDLLETPLVFRGYFHRLPQNGSVIIDAGAYPGNFTIAASQLYPQSRIIALEPDSNHRAALEKNIDLNKAKVEVFPYALSDDNGTSRLCSEGLASRLVFNDAHQTETVETVTLDTLLQRAHIETDVPLFIKLDIEGAEVDVITNAPETLKRGATFIIAAYHVVGGKKTADTLEPYFREHGYTTKRVNPRHLTLIAHRN